MKKLLYIAFKDFSIKHYGGNRKVLSQCNAFRQYGYEVDLIGRNKSDIVLKKSNDDTVIIKHYNGICKQSSYRSVIDKLHQFKIIKEYLKGRKYDACYIRYDLCNKGFINLLKQIHKICPKIVIELPTYPYEQEYPTTLIYKPKIMADKRYRQKMKYFVGRLVTFYDVGEKIFDIPTIVIPNGFDFSEIDMIKSNEQDKTIHIITISSMRAWHAYERFIEGLNNYYSNGGIQDIVLHLGGEGKDLGLYKGLVEKYKLQSHVVFDGPLHGEKMEALFEKCQIGIDSLGRHRTNISVLSSLKSREYGAKGIPFINSCDIDIIEDDFPYIHKVPTNESAVDIVSFIEFYDKTFSNGKSRIEIAKEIRRYIENKADMKATLKNVVSYFEA